MGVCVRVCFDACLRRVRAGVFVCFVRFCIFTDGKVIILFLQSLWKFAAANPLFATANNNNYSTATA